MTVRHHIGIACKVFQEIHERFGQGFTNNKFAVDFKTFQNKLPDLCKKFSTWNSIASLTVMAVSIDIQFTGRFFQSNRSNIQ